MLKGIDVSRWQGSIDFNKVKADFIDFAIIKAGGSDKGFYTDKCFMDNYKKAKAVLLPVGCYYFAGKDFKTKADGIADAKRFLDIIKGLQFEYPVFLDIEAQPVKNKKGITSAAYHFCKTVEDAGYFVGIYASDISGFKNRLYCDDIPGSFEDIDNFVKWVANYSRKPAHKFGIWQYSSKGCVGGIHGNVDLDYSTTDYSKIIKAKKLNGF